MAKKDTRRKMINPSTGRKVFMTGEVGKKLRAKKAKQAKRSPSNVGKKAKGTCRGGVCCPFPVPLIKTAGKTKGYAARPSAGTQARMGDFTPKVYGGWLHVMQWDSLGRPSYKAVCPMRS